MTDNAGPSLFSFRIFREYQGVHVVVGPWAAVVSWERFGRFGNGSRWFSGWHRWDDPKVWGE